MLTGYSARTKRGISTNAKQWRMRSKRAETEVRDRRIGLLHSVRRRFLGVISRGNASNLKRPSELRRTSCPQWAMKKPGFFGKTGLPYRKTGHRLPGKDIASGVPQGYDEKSLGATDYSLSGWVARSVK